MEPTHSMLLPSLLICWAVITGILAILVVYRITLSGKETSEIAINNPTEQRRLQDQEVLVSKMSRLKVPITVLVVVSSALLLTSAGIWIYQGLLKS